MTKKLSPVAQLAADLTDDATVGRRVESEIAKSRMVSFMTGARLKTNVLQREIAERLGWRQSKVSRIEAGTDDQVTFMDVVSYLSAVGLNLHVYTTPKESSSIPSSEQLKQQVAIIASLLSNLNTLTSSLAEKELIDREIMRFRSEVLFRLLTAFESGADGHPDIEQAIAFDLGIEAQALKSSNHKGDADRQPSGLKECA